MSGDRYFIQDVKKNVDGDIITEPRVFVEEHVDGFNTRVREADERDHEVADYQALVPKVAPEKKKK